jgi:hypothetical protein
MKKFFTLQGIIMLITAIINTQTRQGKISAAIKDDNQRAIQPAVASLLRVDDVSLVRFASTNKIGEYEQKRVGGEQ